MVMAETHVAMESNGFGPFEGHPVNASWEAVKELSKRDFPDGVNLHTKDIPVEYLYVEEEIPNLEKELNPDLIIHVGVSGVTECLQIEERAHSYGYVRGDIKGNLPNKALDQECLTTSLDIADLRMFCDKCCCSCRIERSEDAGRYLCEFIYYTSLRAGLAPTLFVHVPCLDQPYAKEELADALKYIILAARRQIAAHSL